MSQIKKRYPFEINGIVILPEHLHMMISLPKDDSDYPLRIRLIKSIFSRQFPCSESISFARQRKKERVIWQRRYWEHCIRDEKDYERHLNYIHYNPVKHGYVKKASDWQYSSIHRYIEAGILCKEWGGCGDEDRGFGSRDLYKEIWCLKHIACWVTAKRLTQTTSLLRGSAIQRSRFFTC